MINGKIKWFDEDKGYGFIKAEDGTDYFCHYSAFPNGHTHGLEIKEGDAVAFEVITAEDGRERATNIQLVY